MAIPIGHRAGHRRTVPRRVPPPGSPWRSCCSATGTGPRLTEPSQFPHHPHHPHLPHRRHRRRRCRRPLPSWRRPRPAAASTAVAAADAGSSATTACRRSPCAHRGNAAAGRRAPATFPSTDGSPTASGRRRSPRARACSRARASSRSRHQSATCGLVAAPRPATGLMARAHPDPTNRAGADAPPRPRGDGATRPDGATPEGAATASSPGNGGRHQRRRHPRSSAQPPSALPQGCARPRANALSRIRHHRRAFAPEAIGTVAPRVGVLVIAGALITGGLAVAHVGPFHSATRPGRRRTRHDRSSPGTSAAHGRPWRSSAVRSNPRPCTSRPRTCTRDRSRAP